MRLPRMDRAKIEDFWYINGKLMSISRFGLFNWLVL